MHLRFCKAWISLYTNICWCSFSHPFAVQVKFLPSQLSLLIGRSGHHLIHGSWGPPESTARANGISIGSAVVARLKIVTERPTDRQTDHATQSVTIGRIYIVVSQWLNNKLCNILTTDGTNQWHDINGIYIVHLYQPIPTYLNAHRIEVIL